LGLGSTSVETSWLFAEVLVMGESRDEVLHCFRAGEMIAGRGGARGGREGFGRASQATGVMHSLDKDRLAVPGSLGGHLW
jgi:hypothetical protein